MHLFLIDDIDQPVVRGDDHRHLSRVLRLQPGDTLLLSQGDGRVAEAVILALDREETRCRTTAVHAQYNEPPVAVTVCQGILKNHSKLDWLVEKGTELGMHAFIPMHTERTIGKSVKTERLQHLAVAAAKQCHRGRTPAVRSAQHLTAIPGSMSGTRLLLFHESAEAEAVPEALTLGSEPIALFLGPEGGFSEEEVVLLRSHGAEVLSLGPRRLRGETAALAALTRVMALVGGPHSTHLPSDLA